MEAALVGQLRHKTRTPSRRDGWEHPASYACEQKHFRHTPPTLFTIANPRHYCQLCHPYCHHVTNYTPQRRYPETDPPIDGAAPAVEEVATFPSASITNGTGGSMRPPGDTPSEGGRGSVTRYPGDYFPPRHGHRTDERRSVGSRRTGEQRSLIKEEGIPEGGACLEYLRSPRRIPTFTKHRRTIYVPNT